MVIGWLINMASAKQIKARKEFAKRVKRGDFRKAIAKTKKLTLKEAIEFKQKGFETAHQYNVLNPYIPKRKKKRKFSRKQLAAQRLFAKRARAGTLRRRRR